MDTITGAHPKWLMTMEHYQVEAGEIMRKRDIDGKGDAQ